MIRSRLLAIFAGLCVLAVPALPKAHAEQHLQLQQNKISHVLLLSIDGMHALDLSNCVHGVAQYGNVPYCPHLAKLLRTGINYVAASTSKPSDSFPGLTALVTGGTPRSTGAFYDVSYDRSLSPPYTTTPYGIVGGPTLCPGVVGTQVGFDEEIDIDLNNITAGGGINWKYLPRDPKNGCKPVYPHEFIRVNTIFNVVKSAGGYTAWSDKHQSYELTKGPTGDGVDDFFAPEINSAVRPLNLPGFDVPSCHTIPDPTATGDWTKSFQNVQCYDKLKVQAILNEIDGKNHNGFKTAPVPTVFGMNFQAVSIGQKLVESSINATGGYLDALGTPSASLFNEIQFVDDSIGQMISELQKQGLYDSTLIIVSAKHGQSPIDPNRLLRIPADNSNDEAPSDALGGIGGGTVAQALEDDISLIWLTNQSQTSTAVATLTANEGVTGGGEIFSGPSLDLFFNDPLVDPRTPDIIQAPNVGVVYTSHTSKVAEHGGFAHDDTNVLMVLSNPGYSPKTVTLPVETRQVAPSILQALGLDPNQLKAVQEEGTQVLPDLP